MTRTRTYDWNQIAESFLRYRGSRIYDEESLETELEKHFSPELARKTTENIKDKTNIKSRIKINRQELSEKGKLPKPRLSNKIRTKKEWRTTRIKGHSTKAFKVFITIKGKKKARYRDSFGRFTSNP